MNEEIIDLKQLMNCLDSKLILETSQDTEEKMVVIRHHTLNQQDFHAAQRKRPTKNSTITCSFLVVAINVVQCRNKR